MKNKREKSPIKNYYLSMILFALLLYAAVIPIIIFSRSLPLKVLVLLLAFLAVKFVNSYLGVKHFISILIVEKDGDKFSAVLKPSKFFSPSATYRALGSYYSGDQAETVSICAKALKSGAVRGREYFFAEKLALSYFELGDDKKLREVLKYFNAYTAASKKVDAIRKQVGAMKFFEAYLGGDIRACEKALEESAVRDRQQYANIYEPQKNFLFAVACCRLGEEERAAELFEKVISDAPKTHFARLAKKYIDAREMSVASHLINCSVLPREDYEIYGKKMRAYMKMRTPILILATAILVIILILW